ncbi:prepilin-type N-terminal cleavage/methylation domain-containing protein [Pseudomonas sp. NPDC089554]|uniref:prepilin-type N-terminal cleavage/methylation domain-containing protein n=1 Tax=Pseudomonas sp. NPDC089554 TaxID=3390653 RepID=UPI003CFF07FF
MGAMTLRRSRGFTLLELLLVLAVLGVVIGMAGLAPTRSPQRLAAQEAQLFLQFFEHVREQATLQGQTLGIQVDEHGYRLARLTEQGWRGGGKPQSSELALHLRLDDTRALDGPAQLVLAGDEEHVPFTLYFSQGDEALACVVSDGLNAQLGC